MLTLKNPHSHPRVYIHTHEKKRRKTRIKETGNKNTNKIIDKNIQWNKNK